MIEFYVYVHMDENLIPFYVGKGSGKRAFDLTYRNRFHTAKLRKHSPIIEIQKCNSEAEAFFRERLIIAALRNSGHILCNLTDGGEGFYGATHTEEAKQKISKSKLGVKLTEAHKKSLSLAKKDYRHTLEEIESLSKIMTGKHHSEETKAKISASQKGKSKKPMSEETKRKLSAVAKNRIKM